MDYNIHMTQIITYHLKIKVKTIRYFHNNIYICNYEVPNRALIRI